MFSNVEGYSGQNSIFAGTEWKYHTEVYNIISIFLVWAASKLLPTNLVNIFVFWSVLNSCNIYARLMSFRITCFTRNGSKNNKFWTIKTTEKSFAEQKPQSKVISITRVQTNELLIASQQVASYEPKSCKLRVYHITIQLIVSLSHFELQASEVMTCQLMLRLWHDFSRKRLNLSRDKCMTLKNMPTFLKILYSKILRFSMVLMSEILGTFIFLPDVYFTVFILLNRTLTLRSNWRGAILQTEN